MQGLKQGFARRVQRQIAKRRVAGQQDLFLQEVEPVWQRRFYDFSVWSERKPIEKLRYIHRNPVKRGLCTTPMEWRWSSFCHYATAGIAVVEIESQWTAERHILPG